MEVKGVAFLARQQMTVQSHGEQAWKDFVAEFKKKEPVFGQPILPVTRIPVDAFLRFNEELLNRLYGGDRSIWWQFGVKSAEYALGQGQLKSMFAPGDFRRFLYFTPGIWKGYFTAGEMEVLPGQGYTDLHILKVPKPHVYFELSVMGFGFGGLSSLGAKDLKHEVIKSFSKGDPDVIYRFNVT
ncbi:hypothetical protein LZ198_17435 [Myxococcus sp. K15C18031901]|uniref:hypothetical protein n=1 Tax=Myxococcus dinghuensis TaxID=2906761 RepID=UPI0020A7065D|nr:hypothetical protein [Myxococcus dinghuensis]MCP3100655.1 hypothetical protein [Myxococcus dinghuensis]